jgi:hypothetical protein
MVRIHLPPAGSQERTSSSTLIDRALLARSAHNLVVEAVDLRLDTTTPLARPVIFPATLAEKSSCGLRLRRRPAGPVVRWQSVPETPLPGPRVGPLMI